MFKIIKNIYTYIICKKKKNDEISQRGDWIKFIFCEKQCKTRKERGERRDGGGGKERRFSRPDPLGGKEDPVPRNRKLVRAASDCEDSRVVLYAELRRDIGPSHRTPSDDFPADSFLLMGFRYTRGGWLPPAERFMLVSHVARFLPSEEDPSTLIKWTQSWLKVTIINNYL